LIFQEQRDLGGACAKTAIINRDEEVGQSEEGMEELWVLASEM
jgi:hypothetical protein